jgi:excisionase family DNA binding protein
MEHFTFETLPLAVSRLAKDVSEIKQILLETSNPESQNTDCWFNIEELCIYLPDKPSKATVYGWVSKGLIPVHKSGKKLRFLKSEIDRWLMQGGRMTQREAAIEADKYLVKKKKG